MKASIQALRPSDAEMLLQGNQINRPLNKRRVEKYAKEMREGRWLTNGSSISIFDDGEKVILLNGQHRLRAFILSGLEEMTFVIVEEDTTDVFSTFDIGGNRNTANVLAIAGYANTNVLQAMARIVMFYERSKGSKESWQGMQATTPEVLEWVKKTDPHVLQMVTNNFAQAHKSMPATNTWYAGLAYMVLTTSPNRGEWLRFHHGYHTGIALDEGSAILALRQYTINRARLNDRYRQNDWDRQAHVAIGIKAWNDFLKGKSVGYYKFTRNSLPMPEVH